MFFPNLIYKILQALSCWSIFILKDEYHIWELVDVFDQVINHQDSLKRDKEACHYSAEHGDAKESQTVFRVIHGLLKVVHIIEAEHLKDGTQEAFIIRLP